MRLISEKTHISEFRNKRVGVDVFGWLHKGAFGCAYALCNNKPTKVYVRYVIERVQMLLHYQVIPVVVFDGAGLPMKAKTHDERRKKRAEALEKAKSFEMKKDMKAALEWYQRAVPVTNEMVQTVIRELREMNVEYLVAPYEADAQLAWMAINGHIDCVLTEDSDLIVYGAPRIIYKVDKDGSGDLFNLKNLPSLDKPPMYNITPDMFMWMCVCAGCDFFEGVKNLGMKRAHALVKKCRTLSRLLHSIRADQRYPVEKNFMVDFYRACLVFRHQTVFDLTNGKAVHFSEFEEAYAAMLPSGIVPRSEDGTYDLNFLGRKHDDIIMKRIAEGYVDPKSLEEYSKPRDAGVIDRPMSGHYAEEAVPVRSKTFRVLPASRSNNGSSGSETNARNRLARSPISFDPLSMVSKYFPTKPPTKQPNKIWARFKRPKSLTDVDKVLGHTFGSSGSAFRVSKKPRLIENGKPSDESPQRSPRKLSREDESSGSPLNRAKRRLSSTSPNTRVSPTTPQNSLTRFINRFQARARPSNKFRSSLRNRDDADVDKQERERKKPRCGSSESNENRDAHGIGSKPIADPAAGSTNQVMVISDDENNSDVDDTAKKEDDGDYVIRSRFFPPGKQLMLPAKSLIGRGRPLIPDSVLSRSRSKGAVLKNGKHGKGRTVINKKLKQREIRRHTS